MDKPRKSITLVDYRDTVTGGFVVKNLTNSIEFKIGQVIDNDEAARLADSRFWTVKVIGR